MNARCLACTKCFLVALITLGFGRAVSSQTGETKESIVGKPAPSFALRDTAGRVHDSSALRAKKAVVLVFIGNGCPMVTTYLPRLNELSREFEPKGVQFFAINSNRHDSLDEVTQHAKEHSIAFPVLKDERNVVADQFGARRTPEAFLVDADGVVRYQGRVDDQFGVAFRRAQTGRRDLANAIDELLAGKTVSVPTTPVEGCLIGRFVQPTGQSVTYSSDVARIIQNRCQVCHRPGQVAPFPLMDYDDASGWAPMIKEVVEQRRMPPWHARPEVGTFSNDRSLSSEERKTLIAWVDGGAPMGDPCVMPAPREFPSDWALGVPDLVLKMDEEYTVPANAGDEYRYFSLPTGLTKDRWVRAVEIRPGNRRVVHHVIAMVRAKEDSRRRGLGSLLAPGLSSGSSINSMGWLAAMAPGNEIMICPPGAAKLLPAESTIVFQMHYHPVGTPERDRTTIAIYFSDEREPTLMRTHGIAQPRFVIAPYAKDTEVRASLTAPADVTLWSMMPHMHLRGRTIVYTATYPDGTKEDLLDVPSWDFNWQTTYRLATPKQLPRGTRIDVVAHYDNSANNPHNPNPNATVMWGEPTYAEMMIGFLDFTTTPPKATPKE